MNNEQLMKEALKTYCTPYGKDNPETHAFIAGCISPASKAYWESQIGERVKGLEEELQACYKELIVYRRQNFGNNP